MKKITLLLSFLLLFFLQNEICSQTTVLDYTFENGTLTSSSGSAGNTTVSFASVGTTMAAFNSGVGCTQEAIANGWSANDYWTTGSFNTTGFSGLTLSFIQSRFSGGPGGQFSVEYSFNNMTWVAAAPTNYTPPSNDACAPVYTATNVALPVAMENQPTVYLRWRNLNGSGAGGSRMDNILVSGTMAGGDTTDPNAVCTNITRNLDSSGNVTIMASDVDGGSTDNVGIASRSVSPSSFNCANVGTNNVTLTVTDAAGNSDTCVAVVTIADNTAPVVSNVNDITATLGADGTVVLNNNADVAPAVTATDNCGIQVISIIGIANRTFSCADIATNPNVRSIRVRDVNGNNTFVDVNVNVVDAMAPTITCVGNDTRDTDAGVCNYTIQGTEFDPTFDDNCSSATISNDLNMTATLAGEVLPLGDTTVTWTVNDGNGQTTNCMTVITVADNEVPVISAVMDITAVLGADGTVVISNNTDVADAITATDNCGVDSYFVRGNGGTSLEARTFDCDDIATNPNVRNVRVRDVNGNDAFVDVNVNVVDDTAPTIMCVGDDTRDADATACSYTVQGTEFDPTFDDNCSSATITNDFNMTATLDGAVLPLGDTTVVWTVNDGNGQTDMCTTIITVEDNAAPVVTDVQDITAVLEADGTVIVNNINDVEPAVTATDNCGIQNIRIIGVENRTFSCADIATNPNVREVRVRDENGNNTFVNVNIIVVDDIDPTITCPVDDARDADAGVCEYTVQGAEFDATFDDNCTSATITNDFNNATTLDGAVLPAGDTLITWTVDDGNGQTVNCSFTVTINDNENPVVTDVQDIIAQLDANGTVTIGNNSDVADAVTATDNCGIQSYFVRGINGGTSNEARTFTCDDIATSPNVRTVRVRDVNGNDTDVDINVIVEDNLDPIVTDVQDIIAVLGPDGTVRLDNDIDVAPAITATDNCEILDIRITGGNGMTGVENRTFDCDDIANNPHVRRVRVRDVNGNRALVDVNVIVQDNTGVIITDGPLDIFTGTGSSAGECGAIVNYGVGIAAFVLENNCGDDSSIVFEQTAGLGSGAFFPVGTTSEEFSFTDNNGNVTTYSFDVTITDTTLPVIACPGQVTVGSDDEGNYTIEDYTDLATDNCSSGTDLVITQEPAAGTVVTDPSTTEVTIIATDEAGNTTTCAFNLVVDETLGVNDEAFNNSIILYPNPTNDIINITSKNGIDTITIYDLRGRVVENQVVTETSAIVSMASLSSGVYLLQIAQGENSIVKRVIKE
ncbi:HYR domain-containing protein [Dokdonia sinensis]|uniref:HYR domain-containing protein n=1 Tax=Dokdonia sinensis TaxID=2479847 RepID=A0A3M0GMS5_9FLAO|nr:HYR domain-containing protein [Dokdonia sinensis]RMB62933.1 HYR domain-containing protein [Dokdonia sinensis]